MAWKAVHAKGAKLREASFMAEARWGPGRGWGWVCERVG